MEEYSEEKYKDPQIQQIKSEIVDNETSYINYEVLTYPTDYSLEGLFTKIEKKQIVIPEFQRNYVWSISQASKLIESFLLGLPVPAIFLYTDQDENLNVIDGQQRLLSIFYFFKGYFGEESKGKKTVFKLVGLKEDNPYFNATYSSLKTNNPAAFNKLNDAVLRAFIVKQIRPNDNTSIYHIFERLNTGGTQLQGQEIRNCVYHGKFNDLLAKINKDENWRLIFGSKTINKRKRDEEIILRFFALYYQKEYTKPMKDFLSNFMAKYKNPTEKQLNDFETLFKTTCEIVIKALGEKPFNISKGLNVAVFDSVFTNIAKNLSNIKHDELLKKYRSLIKDTDFIKNSTSATTDETVLKERFKIAEKMLFK